MNWILIVTLSIFSDYYCQSPETSTFQNFEDLHKSDPLIIHGIRQHFVKIPEGEFLIGSDDRSEEQTVHRVRIASFDLAITEVTVRQFRAFVQATRYRTDAETIGHSFACSWRPKLGITWRNPGFLQDDNEPVMAISWNDAVAYCR